MTTSYTNLPPITTTNSNGVLQAFANYYTKPIQLNVGILDAMTAFFTARGFNPVAAQSLAVTIINQAND